MMPPMTPPICPPGIPPGTPPTTPADITGGGASSSLIIWTFSGIFVGVSRWLLMILVCTCFTILTGAAAGGGGGGGGGGATRKVINCCLGRASVKMRGIRTMSPTRAISRMIANVVVRPRLVFNLPPDSRRLSSNITVSPYFRAYVSLDTEHFAFAPECGLHRQGLQSSLPAPILSFPTYANKGLTRETRQHCVTGSLPGLDGPPHRGVWPSRSSNPDRPPGSALRSRSTNKSQSRCQLPARG